LTGPAVNISLLAAIRRVPAPAVDIGRVAAIRQVLLSRPRRPPFARVAFTGLVASGPGVAT
ncbi:MAG: hypothetical protein MUE50_25290, partial [Pirellulaceae bacterium]|nr:hypothetical protein [Pirellulaceae bacterium]